MNLRAKKDEELIHSTNELVKIERGTTTQILYHLLEIENRRLFAKLGYSSLFDFATRNLGYSEAAAHRRISSMRLLREIPDLAPKLNDGTLSLTNVAKAQSVFQAERRNQRALNRQQKVNVLKKLESKSTRDAEKTLLEFAPQSIPREQERQVTAEMTEIKILADQALMEKLRKLKNLMSHKSPSMGHKELLDILTDMALEKLDPQIQATKVRRPTSGAESKRRVPDFLRRQIFMKYRGRCAYKSADGVQCGSTKFLEVHHIKPFAAGGLTTESNLTLLCRAHNGYRAIEDFGWAKMAPFMRTPH